jgi:NTE family protein
MGCQGLERRPSPTGPQETAGNAPGTAPGTPGQPAPVVVPGAGTITPPPPVQQAPTFLSKELPKVGLILGPGGMKTFAQIGVLREFARARIPIEAVAGLEWGSVIGGLYSMQGQVNDVEWRSFKLRETDLPQSGLFSSRAKAQSITTLNEFLETAFGNATIEKSKIDFGCPAYWSRQDRFGWMAKGNFKEAMRACLPYPPNYTDNGGVVAAPMSVAEASAWLRARGANLIVLVDVLSQGEALPAKMSGNEWAENLLWSEIRREMQRSKTLVNHVIMVNTSGHPINDYNGRRALMDAGAKSASDTVTKMANQYGF